VLKARKEMQKQDACQETDFTQSEGGGERPVAERKKTMKLSSRLREKALPSVLKRASGEKKVSGERLC